MSEPENDEFGMATLVDEDFLEFDTTMMLGTEIDEFGIGTLADEDFDSIAEAFSSSPADTLKRKFDVRSKTSFLDLPREVRQQVLFETVSDDDIEKCIHTDEDDVEFNDSDGVICDRFSLGDFHPTPWEEFGDLFEHEPFSEVEWLKDIHNVVSEDLEWVPKKWNDRICFLGEKAVRRAEVEWEYNDDLDVEIHRSFYDVDDE